MIQFPCSGCGQVFSVADDEAGRSIQCPQCARLTDVPTHSDLGSLAEDGTFKLIEPARPAVDPAERVAEIALAFQQSRVDDEGEFIDLRNTPEELAGLDEPIALEPGQRQRYKPQYDPETGELVRPLDVRPHESDVDPESIPMATLAPVDQSATINYASSAPLGVVAIYTRTPFRKLLEPVNLAVMAFVLLGLAIGYTVQLLLISIIEQTFAVPIWPLNMMFWLAAAHFGNTIVAIGPEEHDELPRPLLSLGFWDDVFGPICKVLGAFLICYFPMLAVLAAISGPTRAVALPLMLIGGYYFPAIVLTLMTSGSIANLHPNRIRNVIRLGGKRYFRIAVGWIIIFPVYVWATLRVNLVFSALDIETGPYQRSELLLAVPLAVLSVFFLHYLCWQLGLLFRAGHERFGWVWEELLRQREEDRKKRGMSAADRAIMRRERQRRAAAAAAAGQSTSPGPAGSRLGPR